LTVTS